MINNKISKLDWYIIGALLLILLLREGCNRFERNKLVANISQSYIDSTSHYNLILHKHDSINVATNQVLQLDNENQLKAITGKNDTIKKLFDKFKRIKSVLQSNSTIEVKNVVIPYKSDSNNVFNIPCQFDPFNLTLDSVDIKMDANVYPTKFEIINLELPDQETIVVGEKKNGFLGRKTTIDVMHSNKYIRVNSIKGYTISEKKWYDNKWITFIGGAIIGGTLIKVLAH